MEFCVTPIRGVILIVLLVVFYFLGGFIDPSSLESAGSFGGARLSKAWIYTILLFTTGAVSATLIEHQVGNFSPINLRFLYILLGIGLMIGGVLWGNALRQAVEMAMSVAV